MHTRLKRILMLGAGLLLLLLAALPLIEHYLPRWIDAAVQNATGRDFAIDGGVEVDWSLQPLISARRIRLANASWSDQPQMLEIEQLQLRIDLPRLLFGKVVLPELSIEGGTLRLEQDRQGRPNWVFKPEQPPSEEPVRLPQIERLALSRSELVYREYGRQTELRIALRADPDPGEPLPLRADGDGQFRAMPLTLQLRGGALSQLHSEQGYALTLAAGSGNTRARLDGKVLAPQRPAQSELRFDIHLSGPDLARINELTGISLPALSPYTLTGTLRREGQLWLLQNAQASVGDSDISGELSLDLSQQPPRLMAELTSQRLDFDDLGGAMGVPPDPGETASAAQKEKKREQQASGKVLPDDPIDLQGLRAINASVHYVGRNVQAGKLPIDRVTLQLRLQDGRLGFDPLDLHIGDGELRNRFHLDASRPVPEAEWEMELRQVDLHQLLQHLELANESVGRLGGRGKFWLRGRSIAALLGQADGGAYLLMSGGRLDHLLVEVAGLDLSEALGSLIGKEPAEPIDCAYADLQARDGVLNLETVVIDTADTLFSLTGQVNLGTEQLDITINPQPKDPSLLAARSQIEIGGSFAAPKVRPGAAAVLKGAAAAALATVAGPAAALLPLIETGSGGEAEVCRGVVASMQAAEQDAPQQEMSR